MFILVVERNSIGSPAVEGGDFLESHHDVLSGVEFGDIRSQTFNPGKQTKVHKDLTDCPPVIGSLANR